MHKILFRAKAKHNNKWIEGFYCRHEMRQCSAFGEDSLKEDEIRHYIIRDKLADWNMAKEAEVIKVIPETVCQFTGRIDKNNIKVFSGDILGGIVYGSVEWNNEKAGFVINVLGEINEISLEELEQSELEVIGNIFDNLGMLKGVLK